MDEISIFIADTPCVVQVEDDGRISRVMALDGGGDGFGPRRLSVSRELCDEILQLVKELTSVEQTEDRRRYRDGDDE